MAAGSPPLAEATPGFRAVQHVIPVPLTFLEEIRGGCFLGTGPSPHHDDSHQIVIEAMYPILYTRHPASS